VAHAFNPSYAGGGDEDDCGSKQVQTESYQDFISTKKLGVVVHGLVIPATQETELGGSWSKASPGQKCEILSEK
jgi:hypothetical protein